MRFIASSRAARPVLGNNLTGGKPRRLTDEEIAEFRRTVDTICNGGVAYGGSLHFPLGVGLGRTHIGRLLDASGGKGRPAIGGRFGYRSRG